MSLYQFDQIIDRMGTNSLKWEHITTSIPDAPTDALPLWVADMDFPCATPIIDALHQRVDRRIFGYSIHDTPAYYDAVTGWFARRFDWHIDGKSIFYSPGVVPAIGFLLSILAQKGDGVIIQPPVYYPFARKINNHGLTVVNSPLRHEQQDYTMDYDDLADQLSKPENKGILFCSPHNPVGRVWREDELQQLVALCQRYDKWIISDEIHCDIVRNGHHHIPLEKLCPEYKHRIFTCTAPSKSFNLAGMQLSNIIINDPAVQAAWLAALDRTIGPCSPNPFAIVATIAAYNDSEDWLDQANAYIDQNVRYVENFVAEHLPRVTVTPCQGTYLMWLDFTAYGLAPQTLEHRMLQEAKIALDEGYFFGVEGNGFERINVACPRAILENCLTRIQQFFA